MFFKTPYIIVFATALLMVIVSFFADATGSFDLHLTDKFFIITWPAVFGGAAIFLFLYGLVCIATRNLVYSQQIAYYTIIASLLLVLFIVAFAYFNKNSGLGSGLQQYLEDPRRSPILHSLNKGAVVVYAFVALVLVQATGLINLLIGVYRNSNRQVAR